MAFIEEVEWEPCLLEPGRNRGLERYVRQEMGRAGAITRYFAECPWVPRSMAAFNFYRGKLIHSSIELGEKISLVVAQENSCRYCFAVQRLLMRLTGMSEQRIRRLEQDLLTADLEPRERAVLEFARRLSRANPLPTAADLNQLRDQGYSDGAIREIVVVTAYMCAINRFATLPALPPETLERLPERWPVRLLRPLIGGRFKARWRKGTLEHLDSKAQAGPFAYLVSALDGLPSARSLRTVVDEAWSSPLLSQRAKALVIAVVARGLGCELSEREAVRLLVDLGLAVEDVQTILAHLASPKLDPIEATVLPFARETIWYRPAPVQRRARVVRDQLSGPQFLEALGIASLANMLCRLNILVQEA